MLGGRLGGIEFEVFSGEFSSRYLVFGELLMKYGYSVRCRD